MFGPIQAAESRSVRTPPKALGQGPGTAGPVNWIKVTVFCKKWGYCIGQSYARVPVTGDEIFVHEPPVQYVVKVIRVRMYALESHCDIPVVAHIDAEPIGGRP
jgi:hypothetical protein